MCVCGTLKMCVLYASRQNTHKAVNRNVHVMLKGARHTSRSTCREAQSKQRVPHKYEPRTSEAFRSDSNHSMLLKDTHAPSEVTGEGSCDCREEGGVSQPPVSRLLLRCKEEERQRTFT